MDGFLGRETGSEKSQYLDVSCMAPVSVQYINTELYQSYIYIYIYMNQLMMNHKYHGYIVFEARVSLKIINFLGRQKSPQTHCFPDSENWMRGKRTGN